MRQRLRLLGRGLTGRCPRCGARGIFASFFELEERCHGCGLAFEREEGYWLGAMVIDLAVTEVLFGLLLVGTMLVTWPAVPWTPLLVAAVIVNAVVPVVAYPWSRTVWLALDLTVRPPSVAEEAEALTHRHERGDR